MKKLLLLLTLLCSLTTLQAQDTIKIPTPIAKSIIHDLISGDSAKVELKLTKEVLDSTEKKVVIKDSLIAKWQSKYMVCDNNLRNEKTKFELQSQYVTQLERGKTKLKVVTGFFIFTTIFALLK